MNYDGKKQWENDWVNSKMAWPAEYVIRIFKGKYPKLNLREKGYEGKKICDIGCGDGRNLYLLKKCGFDIYGVEITESIVNKVKANLSEVNIKDNDIRVGNNENIPFEDGYFDYLLSWNSCYYMGQEGKFEDNVYEFSRVLKTNGILVCSIPMKSCFIYQGAEEYKEGYYIIKNDPFNVRNGEILRMFKSENEIENAFSKHFKNFIFATIQDDCFGFNYHWHLMICEKR